MPTIDQLAPATAASDSDEFPVSQAGYARKLTRAQLLAGVQPGLALPAGSLLGRTSSGTGIPELISVGPNLTLAAGTLSAPKPFTTAALPPGQTPSPTDLLPISQSGTDAAIAYGPMMNGLAGLAGIDLSRHAVNAGTTPRSLAASLADHIAIEAFGAVGDGVTDCTSAFAAAIAAGHPVLLGPQTYLVRGQFTVTSPAHLTGTRGRTILRRPSGSPQLGGAWISVQGATFTARGITFDANSHPTESWGVLVTAACSQSLFADCTFANATGPNFGCGLAIAANTAATDHRITGCEATGNALHGIWVQSTTGARVLGCLAHGNGQYGICLDDNDPTFARQVRNALVLGNVCWSNTRGISIGNFNQTNTQPPVWGNANPDAIGVVVADNVCYANSAYGIAIAGSGIVAGRNLLTGNVAGILCNAIASRVDNNVVINSGGFAIDAGGSTDCDLVGNQVSGAAVGINCGGSQRVRVSANRFDHNVWAVTVYNVETDGAGHNFGQTTTALSIVGNQITFDSGSGGGIDLLDAPQTVLVAGNAFFGTGPADISQCLWANTDSLVVQGNTWNNELRRIVNPAMTGSFNQLVLPDIADEVMVTAAPSGIQSMVTSHAATMVGRIAFIRVTAPGAGYTAASVTITGAGAGAAAIAYVRNGAVIGIAVTAPGSGYAAATVAISGDGQGATATASVGLPLIENRRVRIHCNLATRFDRAAAIPVQDNWTLHDLTVPAATTVDWTVTWGSWRATAFAAGQFLAPPGDGSLVMHTLDNGDLTLRPAGAGRLHLGSDAEPSGCTLTVGRGSPDGVVVASPGSDYRNLDGGVGATLWVKRIGTDAHGWTAIA